MTHIHPTTRFIQLRWALLGASGTDVSALMQQLCGNDLQRPMGLARHQPLLLPDLGEFSARAELYALTTPCRHPSLWHQLVARADLVIAVVDEAHPLPDWNRVPLPADKTAVVSRVGLKAPQPHNITPVKPLQASEPTIEWDGTEASTSALRELLFHRTAEWFQEQWLPSSMAQDQTALA